MLNFQDIKISIATAADTPALIQLVNSAYRGESSRKGWTTEADILEGIRIDEASVQEILDDPKADLHTFSLPDEGLIACVYLKETEEHMYLGMLTVRPSLQAGGMGKFILQYAEKFAAEKGKHAVHMTVINKRTELIVWYNRHGYLPTGETEPWIDDIHIGNRKAELHFIVLEKKI